MSSLITSLIILMAFLFSTTGAKAQISADENVRTMRTTSIGRTLDRMILERLNAMTVEVLKQPLNNEIYWKDDRSGISISTTLIEERQDHLGRKC